MCQMNSTSKIDKKDIYKLAYAALNFWLIVAVVLVAVYLLAPFAGGSLSLSAILHYGSWIAVALAARYVLRHARKGLRIRAYQYAILCLVIVFDLVVWFSYPVGVILSIVNIVFFLVYYRAQKRN